MSPEQPPRPPASGQEPVPGAPEAVVPMSVAMSARLNQRLHELAPPQRIVNVRALIILTAAVVLLGVGAHFLHRFQVRRNAQALLDQADRAEQRGDLDQAAQHLSKYIGLRPGDTEARARYGQVLHRKAKNIQTRQDAFLVLDRVVREEPGRAPVRRELVDVAIELRRYPEALNHLEALLRTSPGDADLERLAGECEAALRNYARAADWFEAAVGHAPDRPALAAQLADLLRRHLGQPARADQVMDALVKANSRSPAAYLARWRYRTEHRLPVAWDDVAQALALAPDDADVLMAAAEWAEGQGDQRTARARLERGLERYPQERRLYRALARLETRAGRGEAAAAALRRGLEQLPADAELLASLAELRIEQGELAEADQLLQKLRAVKGLPVQIEYLEARALMVRGEWGKAAARLERLLAQLNAVPQLSALANLALARCHAQLGNHDLRLSAYRRAAADPTLWPARTELAAALLEQDQLDEALQEYAQLPPDLPGVRAGTVRLLVRQNLRLPETQRRWEEAERLALEAAPAEAAILAAEVLAAQKRADDARRVLESARDRRPADRRLWLTLVGLDQWRGEFDRARALLDETERRTGDGVELRLARARWWVARDGPEAPAALAALARGLENFSSEDRSRLLYALADAHARVGDARAAGDIWRGLAAARSSDLRSRFCLFELAQQDGDAAAARPLLDEMRQIEGEGALTLYGEAACLVLEARRRGDRDGLPKARRLLGQAHSRRPSWPRALLLEAEIDELEDHPDRAISRYRQAIDLGERRLSAYQRLLRLLCARRRYFEADDVLTKMQKAGGLVPDLAPAGPEALPRDGTALALALARRAVEGSKDFQDYLWLAQLLTAAGQRDAVDPVLREALRLTPGSPDVWVALVQHLCRTDRRAEAEARIEEAVRALPADEGALALAQCYEMVGRKERAEERYREALKARPADAAVLRGAASFYLRGGQPRQAEPPLRKLIAPETAAPEGLAAEARRDLAVLLAAGGGYRPFQEALALVDQNAGKDRLIDDQRARALVLSTQPSRRRDAIHALDELSRFRPLKPDEQFLLARLREEAGDWSRASDQFHRLLASHSQNADYLAHFTGSLLRRGETAEAESWLRELERREPGSFRALELRVRALRARRQQAEAVRRVREHAGRKDANLPGAADLLLELGQTASAEELYRKHADPRQPRTLLPLARFLTGQKRVREALDQCEQARDAGAPAEAAVASAAVVRSGHADREQRQRVERGLRAAVEKDPKAAVFLIALADFLDHEGRYPEAKAVYRQALEADGRNAAALNNLAWLLAATEDQPEQALALIDRALAEAGPVPSLLDTRAAIHLKRGKSELAKQDLEEVMAQRPTAYRHYLLARVQAKAGRPASAVASLRQAQALGLDAAQLHPLERPAYQELTAALPSK